MRKLPRSSAPLGARGIALCGALVFASSAPCAILAAGVPVFFVWQRAAARR